jgi:Phosphorylase superfamily
VALGDVVAADAVYGYESGKAGQDYAPRIKTDRSAYALIRRAQAICRSATWQARIQPTPSQPPPEAFVGPIAAGEKVVTDFASVVGQLIRANCGDALAVEMEGAGFLYGAWANAARLAMVIRGISDLVSDKTAEHDREWQPIAARHAAAFAFELLDQYGAQGSVAPLGPVRTARLEELERACRARMIGSWQALGVPRQVAIQLADDPAVGQPPAAAVPLPGHVRVLLGDMGAGKTLIGERLHQAAIQRARQDPKAPIPVYLTARGAAEGLREAVEADAQGLGEPRRQGAAVVVDGAEQAGAGVAADLLDEARRLVIEWPETSAVLTSQPLPYLTEAEEAWSVPLLTRDEAEALIARIEGEPQRSFGGLTGLPPAVREAVHRPLFAVLLGTFRLKEKGRYPRSRLELVRSLVDRSLRRITGRWRHAQGLLERLAQLTIDRGGAVLATEIGLPRDREVLLATGLVTENKGALSFPLPILEQWFAAQLLLQDPARATTLAEDVPRLERWRYAIAQALAEANQVVATQLLQPIVLRQPAVASSLVHESLADQREHDQALPPSLECGEQVRAAMAAWVEGIGPVAELVAPVDSDGRLLPLGALSEGAKLLTVWYQGNEPRPDVADLQGDVGLLFSSQAPEWVGSDGVPSRVAGWAWHWTLKQLSRNLRDLIQKRRLPVHEGPLADEANWRLARSLTAGIPRSLHPSGIPLRLIEARLMRVPDTATLVVSGHGALKVAALKLWLQRIQAMGVETLAYPWPSPDLDPDPHSGMNWDWEFYSDQRLLEWAQTVYAGALHGYQHLVEQWFAPFASRLRTAALLPARLVGVVHPPTRAGIRKDRAPGIAWYLEPLPVGSATYVDLALGEHPGFTWEDMQQASHRFRRLRLQASPWLGGSWHTGHLPNTAVPDPATSLVYEWLHADLRDTRWL